MEKQSIREIKDKLLMIKDEQEPFFRSIQLDERKGVQMLIKKWHNQKEKEQKIKEKYIEMTIFEEKYRAEGYQKIAGVDEVGRGPLAGPVVAAAVILPPDFYLPGLDDSKKLSESKRNEFFEKIMADAIAVGIGIIEKDEIDRINILEASKKAMLNAIGELQILPDFLLVDAVKLATSYPFEAIIKGDGRSISIAAASIIAKVTRDRIMVDIASQYPQYEFSQNMGYGTKNHLDAIEMYGITPHHRTSFAPVKDYIAKRK